MPDNRIISGSKYNVSGITRATATDNNLSKRPYTSPPVLPNKRHSNPDSFDDTLHKTVSHNSSNHNSETFSNELENKLRLQSEENLRLAQSKFNHNDNFNTSNSHNVVSETELQNKLSEAMDVEVDVSSLYKKIELLNALKKDS